MSEAIKTFRIISRQAAKFAVPSVTQFSKKEDPYLILVSCILSLRTKDKTTIEAAERLFKAANTPQKMLRLSRHKLEKLIYPVGFYRNKSKVILGLSRRLISDFRGKVPCGLEDLLSLRGVGRKTANLVLGLGFKIPAICVDTHVHRISNRLGWVKTKDPLGTEEGLKKIIPRRYWIGLNTVLVSFGQNICVPVSPFCGRCRVNKLCPRRGVGRHR